MFSKCIADRDPCTLGFEIITDPPLIVEKTLYFCTLLQVILEHLFKDKALFLAWCQGHHHNSVCIVIFAFFFVCLFVFFSIYNKMVDN